MTAEIGPAGEADGLDPLHYRNSAEILRADLADLESRLASVERERDEFAKILASPLADKVVEYGDRAEAAEAKVPELTEKAHYAMGTAELAMKHRDEAEAKVLALETALQHARSQENLRMKQLNWEKVRDELLAESERHLAAARGLSLDNPFYPSLMTASYVTFSIAKSIAEGIK